MSRSEGLLLLSIWEKLKRVRKGIVVLQGMVQSGPGNPPAIVNIEKCGGVQGGILGYDDAVRADYTGGQSTRVTNKVDHIGPARRHLLENK
jgi:hypothetical protein